MGWVAGIPRHSPDADYLRLFARHLGPRFRLSDVCRHCLDVTCWPGPRDRLRRLAAAGLVRAGRDAGGLYYELTPAGERAAGEG